MALLPPPAPSFSPASSTGLGKLLLTDLSLASQAAGPSQVRCVEATEWAGVGPETLSPSQGDNQAR